MSSMIFFNHVCSDLDRNIGKLSTFRHCLKDKVSNSLYFAPILKSDMKEEMFGLKVKENVSPRLIKSCHNVLKNIGFIV